MSSLIHNLSGPVPRLAGRGCLAATTAPHPQRRFRQTDAKAFATSARHAVAPKHASKQRRLALKQQRKEQQQTRLGTRSTTPPGSSSSPPPPPPRKKTRVTSKKAAARAARGSTRGRNGLQVPYNPLALWHDDTPLQMEGRLLFVDTANILSAMTILRMSAAMLQHRGPTLWLKQTDFVLAELARLHREKGCHVLAMVEGGQRQAIGPEGVRMIRAKAVRQPDIGDDALVEYIKIAIANGVDASRLVLITADRALRARVHINVNKRSPQWLRAEIIALDGGDAGSGVGAPVPAIGAPEPAFTGRWGATSLARLQNRKRRLVAQQVQETRPAPAGGSWWQGLVDTLQSVLGLAGASKEGHVASTDGLQRG